MFHAGVGGVGKTSVVQKIVEFAPAFGRSVAVMPSITRSVYARLGITGEKTATEMTPEMQFTLQREIQKTYYESSVKFVLDNIDKDVVMIDRSPLDHISYLLHNLAFHMSLQECLDATGHAWDWLHDLRQACSALVILYYGYPEPWHIAAGERESSDGFRFDSGGKNFMWDCILQSLLNNTVYALKDRMNQKNGGARNKFELLRFPYEGMTIERRARFVLDEVRILKVEVHE